MTQAYNLAILANAVDTSGRLNVATNSTGVLPVANGGTGLSSTPSNGQLDIGNGSGFTRATITAGTGISVTNGAGSISIAATGGGTVTSVATGNGLQGGTITSTGTLSVACPSFNTVGSYVFGAATSNNGSFPNNLSSGGTLPAGENNRQLCSALLRNNGNVACVTVPQLSYGNNLSGTWRWMGSNMPGITEAIIGVYCRVS